MLKDTDSQNELPELNVPLAPQKNGTLLSEIGLFTEPM